MKQRTRCFVLLAALAAATQLPGHAQTTAAPPTTTTVTTAAATATAPKPAVRMGGPDGLPSRDQCTPVTPETKVPWIEVSELPALGSDYWSWCTDLDSAWTTQSYPNPKYEPNRTPEHKERVQRFLAGLKDYVRAESDDWVGYVNEWLGTELPPPTIKRTVFKNNALNLYYDSEIRNHRSAKFEFESKGFGIHKSQLINPFGITTTHNRRLSISEINTTQLCVTPMDLQQAFENKEGYLFRPESVRLSRFRPSPQELEELGGQWLGYEIYVFPRKNTNDDKGTIAVLFSFRPCALRIGIHHSLNQPQGENK